jgi:hypothetical protein
MMALRLGALMSIWPKVDFGHTHHVALDFLSLYDTNLIDGWPGRKARRRIWVAHTPGLRVGLLTLPFSSSHCCRPHR